MLKRMKVAVSEVACVYYNNFHLHLNFLLSAAGGQNFHGGVEYNAEGERSPVCSTLLPY